MAREATTLCSRPTSWPQLDPIGCMSWIAVYQHKRLAAVLDRLQLWVKTKVADTYRATMNITISGSTWICDDQHAWFPSYTTKNAPSHSQQRPDWQLLNKSLIVLTTKTKHATVFLICSEIWHMNHCYKEHRQRWNCILNYGAAMQLPQRPLLNLTTPLRLQITTTWDTLESPLGDLNDCSLEHQRSDCEQHWLSLCPERGQRNSLNSRETIKAPRRRASPAPPPQTQTHTHTLTKQASP